MDVREANLRFSCNGYAASAWNWLRQERNSFRDVENKHHCFESNLRLKKIMISWDALQNVDIQAPGIIGFKAKGKF
ncbi:hypothetical protein Pla110_12120 [Polystyrenella longa]|uniref:Uncharacterized protein n=1 Tax=Polystyrenella longa TaxID=2528007 RepID=A0A518CJV4_9PLAN|nr:hypothetical protein Pla110_12120 [Polystyrenella longa]